MGKNILLIPMDGMSARGAALLHGFNRFMDTMNVLDATDQSGIAVAERQAPITMIPAINSNGIASIRPL